MRSALAVAAGVAFAALWTGPAEATEVRFGLGADYQISRYYGPFGAQYSGGAGLFELTLTVDQRLVKHFSIGGRFGGMIVTAPNETTFGVPLDLALRIHMADDRVYLEGLVGPWIVFSQPTFRGHVALGFGIHSGQFQFGLELGYLDPAPMVGLRLAFRI